MEAGLCLTVSGRKKPNLIIRACFGVNERMKPYLCQTAQEAIIKIGRDCLQEQLGRPHSVFSRAIKENLFPSSWYVVIQREARQKGLIVPDRLFKMKR